MIRLTWLQSRSQNLVTAAGLAAMAIFLALTGPHLAHLYDQTVSNCAAHGDCSVARDALLRHDATLRTWLGALAVAAPALVGIFWGAPLVAREFEAGTHRFIWTQSVSRARWLAVKLGLLGAACMVATAVLSLAVTWWARPLDHAHMARYTTFDMRDVVPVGYAAFAFALAVVAGLVIRRTLPALAAAFVGFIAARLAVWHWVRPHLATLTHALLPIDAAHRVGFVQGSAGAQFVAGNPSIDNAWITSSRIVEKSGHPASAHALHHVLQTACPVIAGAVRGPKPGAGPPDPSAFQHCVAAFAARFRLSVTYQPSGHYWQLQWFELAIFLVAALALVGFCFGWIRRRAV